jgi:hypothetical protein
MTWAGYLHSPVGSVQIGIFLLLLLGGLTIVMLVHQVSKMAPDIAALNQSQAILTESHTELSREVRVWSQQVPRFTAIHESLIDARAKIAALESRVSQLELFRQQTLDRREWEREHGLVPRSRQEVPAQ